VHTRTPTCGAGSAWGSCVRKQLSGPCIPARAKGVDYAGLGCPTSRWPQPRGQPPLAQLAALSFYLIIILVHPDHLPCAHPSTPPVHASHPSKVPLLQLCGRCRNPDGHRHAAGSACYKRCAPPRVLTPPYGEPGRSWWCSCTVCWLQPPACLPAGRLVRHRLCPWMLQRPLHYTLYGSLHHMELHCAVQLSPPSTCWEPPCSG
jgi:hypothetical protein